MIAALLCSCSLIRVPAFESSTKMIHVGRVVSAVTCLPWLGAEASPAVCSERKLLLFALQTPDRHLATRAWLFICNPDLVTKPRSNLLSIRYNTPTTRMHLLTNPVRVLGVLYLIDNRLDRGLVTKSGLQMNSQALVAKCRSGV